MAQNQSVTTDPPPARAPLAINLPGIGIFALSLGVGVIVRLFMPDAIMHGPKAPLPEAGGLLAVVLLFPFLAWLVIWFRAPRSPRLTAFGAAWSTLLAVLTATEIWRVAEWALLPGLAIIVSFALLTAAEWLRLRRAPRA